MTALHRLQALLTAAVNYETSRKWLAAHARSVQQPLSSTFKNLELHLLS